MPVALFGAAAAAVLVVSFIALAAGWSRPRLERYRTRPLFRLPMAVEVLLGALGVAVFAVTVYAGFAGTDAQSDNLAPAAVFVGFWIGIPFLSFLFGNVWRLLSPWRAIGCLTGWIAGRLAGEAVPEPLPYPKALGRWPAALGLFAFAVCELCWAAARDPQPLAILMLIYVAVQFVGMSLYGVEAWTRNGDTFGVWFGLLSRLAPLGRRGDGRLVLRPPVVSATSVAALTGTTAVLLIGIGSTGFDGAKEGALLNPFTGDIQEGLVDAFGMSLGPALELAFVVGLSLCVAAVSVVWALGVAGMPRGELRLTRRQIGRRFAHTLIPIAAAYLVAHYFSLLAYNGQDLWRLASDPLGDGSDLFGGAGHDIDYSILTATAIWYVQAGALVLGHVAALVLAHDRALSLYGSARGATRSQVIMLLVMVCFTVMGLWVLSEALEL